MSIGPGIAAEVLLWVFFSLVEWLPKTLQEAAAWNYRIQSRSFRIGMAFVVGTRMFHPFFHC